MVKVALVTLALLLIWPFTWLHFRKDRPPPHGLIDHSYYYCEKCGTLKGGMWGKGPFFKSFNGRGKEACIHAWKNIPKHEFRVLATKLYGTDWSREDPFWHSPGPDAPQQPPPSKIRK